VTQPIYDNHVDAEKALRAILSQDPKRLFALRDLSLILLKTGRYEEAVRLLRKTLNQQPNAPPVLTMLAAALHALGHYKEALDRAARAIALDAKLAEAHAVSARVLADLGRYDEALSAQARAIELAPDWPHYYYVWGQITRWTADDPRLAALATLVRRLGSASPDESAHVHYAIAKAHSDCGDIERSFNHQLEGAAAWRKRLKYAESTTLLEMEELCRAIDPAWMKQHEGAGDPTRQPVFIVGMPRSGTTLLEQILASHPEVRALGESRSLDEAIVRLCGSSISGPTLARKVARWTSQDLRRLSAAYLEASRHEASTPKSRIVDKAPGNYLYAGLIHAALPNARIIHACRDPLDTCLSIFSILFANDMQPYSYDLGELGRYYRAYEAMMAHWRNVLPPGVMIDVRYEDVVDDLEGQARRIVAHCGLEWDEACLSFHKNDRPVRTPSHAQVRQPIYRSSVGRPRPPRELLQPLLDALGVD